MANVRDLDAVILLLACQLFLEKKLSTAAISKHLAEKLREAGSDFEMNREKVYALIREARRRGFLKIHPPLEATLGERLEKNYTGKFHIAHITDLDHLAICAAEVVAELIERLRREGRKEVHLGLGAGRTSMLVARHLAVRLRAAERLPSLVFHALTSGFRVTQPHTAPVSFFGFFEAVPTEISYVGLFAPSFVPTREWTRMRKSPGVRESFDAAQSIDIVLTSLGSHDHGDFYHFMEVGSASGHKALLRAGWIGDVQYRPYSARAPLTIDTQVRAATLFELSDLVALAGRPDKHVVLVAGPCSTCAKTRSDAIRPLLDEPDLKVWSTIVMDVDSARELLEQPTPRR